MTILENMTGIAAVHLLTIMSGLVAFFILALIWHGLLHRNPLSNRARSLVRHRENLKQGLLKPSRNSFKRREAIGFMRKVTEKLQLLKGEQARKISEKLVQAGWRSKDALVIYVFFKLSLPFIFGAVASGFLFFLKVYDAPFMSRVLIAMVCVVVGAYLPEIYVKNTSQKRRALLQKGLPDALDLMVICAEAGLALDAALTRVSREMMRSAPELADELNMTAIELGFQPERKTALQNLVKRTDMDSIRGVVNTLVQTEKYGTPLAQSLRVLAAEYRNERMLKAEEKAAKLPATLTVPLIVFILPSLFIVLLGPAVLRAIDGLSGL